MVYDPLCGSNNCDVAKGAAVRQIGALSIESFPLRSVQSQAGFKSLMSTCRASTSCHYVHVRQELWEVVAQLSKGDSCCTWAFVLPCSSVYCKQQGQGATFVAHVRRAWKGM